MKQMIAILLGLAMMTIAPMGAVIGQMNGPGPINDGPEGAGDDQIGIGPDWFYIPEPSGFNYTAGVANGTYVDFVLDETTGTITDYVSTIIDYNYFYPMVYAESGWSTAEGNGYTYEWAKEPTKYVIKWFDSVSIGDFVPNGHPLVFRESLVFMGENTMATFSDYQGAPVSYQFGNENCTLTFIVADGITVSDVPKYYELYDIEKINITDGGMDLGVGGEFVDPCPMPSETVEYPYFAPWMYQWDEAYLTIGNVSCSIWVDRGSLEISGQNIVVHTYPGAIVSVSAWIDYSYTYRYEYERSWLGAGSGSADGSGDAGDGTIKAAIENGLMAAVGYLYMGENGQQYNDAKTMNDPTFKMEFKNVERNRFQVEVRSEIKAGRIVTLNVNKQALDAKSMKDIKVLLDGEKAKACSSIEELVNMQGGSKAGYHMVSGDVQNTIFVYVPHFSTHIITVSLVDSVASTVLLPGALAAVFIAALVAAVYLRGRGKDEL